MEFIIYAVGALRESDIFQYYPEVRKIGAQTLKGSGTAKQQGNANECYRLQERAPG